jgi:CheY-like chemotaxis protein
MSRPTILVVDDEQGVVEILAEVLQDEGYAVLKALDGADGLRLAHEHRPSLVISDVMMPRLSGVELVRRLKDSEETASTPTILMSCVPHEPTSSGATCFLGKPFDLDVFLDLVKGYAPAVAAESATRG